MHGEKRLEADEAIGQEKRRRDPDTEKFLTSTSSGHRIVAKSVQSMSDFRQLHLRSPSSRLTMALVNPPGDLAELHAESGVTSQTSPGMMTWEHSRASLDQYYRHLKRLVRTRDVMWNWMDFGPWVYATISIG